MTLPYCLCVFHCLQSPRSTIRMQNNFFLCLYVYQFGGHTATNVKESITRPRDQVYIDPNPGANRDYHEMLLIETSGMHNILEIRIYLKSEQITNKSSTSKEKKSDFIKQHLTSFTRSCITMSRSYPITCKYMYIS